MSTSNLVNNIDVFSLEELRNRLARCKREKEFIETYSDQYAKIEDKNTGHFWDKKNFFARISSLTNPMAFHRIQKVCEFVSSLGKIKVLDVGFGPADLERCLSGADISLFGIDISKKSVNLAKMEFKKWNFVSGNFLDIKIKTKFDAVLVLEVLEHIQPEYNQLFLKKTFNLLKNGSWLVISVPLNEGLREMIKAGQNPNRHVRVYTPDIIKYELSLSGFKVVKTEILYAFNTRYKLKTFICKIFPMIRKPNNMIIYAQKP